MPITYKEVTDELGWQFIERTNENGTTSVIPKDKGNADYQAYLNPDAEHFTPSVIDEAEAK